MASRHAFAWVARLDDFDGPRGRVSAELKLDGCGEWTQVGEVQTRE